MSLFEQAPALSHGQQQSARGTSLWPTWLHARFDRVGNVWTAHRKRTRELRDLYRFSDRELWDVGLSRGDLPAIANGTYRRE
jgi:uncharacterized protein YjiS (DUF1127 family)